VSETGEIAAFYAARLDEEEALAKAAGGGEWRTECTCGAGDCRGYPGCERITGEDITIYPEGGHDCDQAGYIAANDPKSTLASAAADRAILARYEALRHPSSLSDRLMFPSLAEVVLACIRDRAARFSAHPDYRAEWKP
jgi:hypothetical protein